MVFADTVLFHLGIDASSRFTSLRIEELIFVNWCAICSKYIRRESGCK